MQNMAEKELEELKIKSPINQEDVKEQLKKNVSKYDEALSYQKAERINEIGQTYKNKGDYKEAMEFLKCSFDILYMNSIQTTNTVRPFGLRPSHTTIRSI